ncbi:hypothetical protein [Cupriavidus sp. amp6]|uniref:hypothetical protein n=1 Tax=Cupriavidus sp. amp6 TaxID=388051 RepID=UPI0012EC28EC|nr:hypothetical protein [Cupriavidus sp. amp6]
MGLLARIWDWLTSSGSGKPRKGHPDLYPLEVDKLAKELRLVDDAKRLGEAGLPALDATVISGPEASVVQRVEKARQDYVDWAALRLNVLSQDIGRRNVMRDVNRARQADKEFERKASTLLTEQDSLLRTLGETARKSKEELDAFRTEHRLTREAHFPSGTRTYLLYAVLFLLVGVEAVLNARFFAQGLDSGLLGGFTEAGIMAAINVAVAFMLGKFAIRYVNHRRAILKTLGLAALAFSLLVMVCVGMGIAHYRDSLSAEAANPAKAALDAFIEHPLQLRDFFSWALFVISMIFGIASLFDGLFSDDLYPGYGSISRRTLSAVDDHGDELNTLRVDLEELKNEELKALDKTLERAQADVAVFEALIKDKHMAGSRLSTALLDADNSLDALLRKFRTENELHRRGLQRPTYFDRQPDLRPIQIPDFGTAADETELQEQRKLVKALLAEVQEIRARIQAAFNQHFDRLKPLDTHFPAKEIA